jgi:hypothetical protein
MSRNLPLPNISVTSSRPKCQFTAQVPSDVSEVSNPNEEIIYRYARYLFDMHTAALYREVLLWLLQAYKVIVSSINSISSHLFLEQFICSYVGWGGPQSTWNIDHKLAYGTIRG